MEFTEALAAIFKDGKRAARKTWGSTTFIALEDYKLCIKGGLNATTGRPDGDGLFHPWVVTEEDYFAGDWEVVE